VIELDTGGNVVNSWGDPDVLGLGSFHSCMVDRENNVWLTFVGTALCRNTRTTGNSCSKLERRVLSIPRMARSQGKP